MRVVRKILILLLFPVVFLQATTADSHLIILESINNYKNQTPATNALNLDQIIDLALKNNLQLRQIALDYLQVSADFRAYQTIYSPIFLAESYQDFTKLPPKAVNFLTGDERTEKGSNVSLTKPFASGTAITMGVSNQFLKANDTGLPPILPGRPALLPPQPDYYQPKIFLNIKQSLLKNGFGYNDRRKSKMLAGKALIQDQVIRYQVSALLAGIISDYWSVQKAQNLQQISQIEFMTYSYIRDSLVYMVDLGTMENYYLNQFNALVYSSEAKLLKNNLDYDIAWRKLKHDLNYQQDQELSLAKMSQEKVALDTKQLITTALKNRADYLIAQEELKIAEISYQVINNNSLPELNLTYQMVGLGQDEKLSEAVADSLKFKDYKQKVALNCLYIFGNNKNKVERENAKIKLQQTKLKINNLEKLITMQVTNAVGQVETAYENLLKSKAASAQAKTYLNKILAKLKQGSVTMLSLKDAVDMFVKIESFEAEVLLGYNLALLNLDLTTNSLLDKHSLAIEKYFNGGEN